MVSFNLEYECMLRLSELTKICMGWYSLGSKNLVGTDNFTVTDSLASLSEPYDVKGSRVLVVDVR